MKTQTVNGSRTLQVADLMASPEKALPKQTLAKHNILLPEPITETPTAQPRTYYETGIAETIAHGETAVNYLITFGTSYDTNNADLKVASLQAKNVLGNQLVSAVLASKQDNTLKINNRQEVYNPVTKLATRVINELEASNASKKTVADARHFVDKIRGHRIITIKPDETDQNHISACQTSFIQQVQHFSGLIAVVSTEPLYNPIMADLKIPALEAKRDAMIASNQAVGTTQAQLGATRLERNLFFNKAFTGYVDTYLAVKRTVKAIFGATSPEYYQISALTFRRIKE